MSKAWTSSAMAPLSARSLRHSQPWLWFLPSCRMISGRTARLLCACISPSTPVLSSPHVARRARMASLRNRRQCAPQVAGCGLIDGGAAWPCASAGAALTACHGCECLESGSGCKHAVRCDSEHCPRRERFQSARPCLDGCKAHLWMRPRSVAAGCQLAQRREHARRRAGAPRAVGRQALAEGQRAEPA